MTERGNLDFGDGGEGDAEHMLSPNDLAFLRRLGKQAAAAMEDKQEDLPPGLQGPAGNPRTGVPGREAFFQQRV